MGEGPSLHILSRQPAERKPDFKLHLSSAVSNYSSCGVTWKTITSIQQEKILVADKQTRRRQKKNYEKRSRDKNLPNFKFHKKINYVGRYCTNKEIITGFITILQDLI